MNISSVTPLPSIFSALSWSPLPCQIAESGAPPAPTKAEKAAVAKFNATEKDVENVVGKLIALNPAKLLKAGYMRAEKAGGPITSAADVAVGDKLKLHAAFGSLDVTVDNIDITEVE